MLNAMAHYGKTAKLAAVLLTFAIVLIPPAIAPASAAPDRYDFMLEEITTGETLKMAQLVEDKPLVVHIWSPDCPHCQRHMPFLVAFYRKLDLESVNFVTCSMADSRRLAEGYIRDKRLSFPVLLAGTGKISSSFEANGWPTTFVFAPGGKLVGTCDTQSSGYVSEMLDLVDRALDQ